MNTEPVERDHTYLAEGEIPDGADVCYVGVEAGSQADTGEEPIDLPARSRQNRLRRFRCVGRIGGKILSDPGGDILIEVAA